MRKLAILLTGLCCMAALAGFAAGAVRVRPPRGVASQPAAPAPTTAEGVEGDGQPPAPPKEDPKELEEFIRGANLETDSEVQALLRRAREHLEEKRYREAVTVLQHVIDRPANTLSTTDGRVYRSTQSVAAEMLAVLPKEGLDVYRLWADGEARGLVGDVDRCVDGDALNQVVRRFFLSSIGDRAAFRLANLAMDRYEFSLARRLYSQILGSYPNPSVDRGQVLARLALACARMNDSAGAAAAWAKLTALRTGSISPTATASIEKELKTTPPSTDSENADWRMMFGSPRRSGRGVDLPDNLIAATEKLWTLQWDQAFSIDVPLPAGVARTVMHPGVAQPNKRETLMGYWEQNNAVPTCQLARVGDRLFFKTLDALLCVDLRSGRRVWEAKEHASAGPTPPNVYAYNYGYGQEPQAVFVDHVGRSISIIEDRIYHIEENVRAQQQYRQAMVVINGRAQPNPEKPLEGNALSAHDAASGRRLWRLGREADENKPLRAARFLAPPTPCLGRLLVPVEEKGELQLLALNPSDGAVLWRIFLCTYSTTQMQPTRPVGVWVDGTEVFVGTGKGVVFAIDGADGSLLWASRYEPQQPKEAGTAMALSHRMYRFGTRGWQEDYIVAEGGLVVTTPADTESVMAFDRRTGKLAFSREIKLPRYCLGILDGALYAATAEGVLKLSLPQGQVAWSRKVAENRGRGVLAGNAIYMPSGKKVVRLDAKTGQPSIELVVKGAQDDPLGNLLIAGHQIIAAGMDRVSSLVNARALFEELDKRIAAKPDVGSLLERGLLHRSSGRLKPAAEDLRRAVGMAEETKKGEIRPELLTTVLALAREDGAGMESLLREATELAKTPGERAWVAITRAESLAKHGKTKESALAWRDVALSGGQELVTSADDKTLRVTQAMMAAHALRSIGSGNAAAKGELASMADGAIRQAMGQTPPQMIAALQVFSGVASVRPIREVQAKLQSANQTEAAESLLREMAADGDARLAAAALASLAELHQKCGWRGQAKREWERLAAKFGSVSIAGFDGEPKGSELARKQLSELGAVTAVKAGMPDPPWKIAWNMPGEGLTILRPSAVNADGPFFLEHVLVLNPQAQTVRCVKAGEGKQIWEINLPKLAAAGAAGTAVAMRMGAVYHGAGAGTVSHDGSVLLMRHGRSITAYSLLTGRALWEQKDIFATVLAQHANYYGGYGQPFGEPEVGAGSGMAVLKVGADVVRVVDLATGSTRWERSMKRAAINAVGVRCGQVLVTTMSTTPQGMQSVTTMVCDRLTGRTTGQINWDNRGGYYGGVAVWTEWGCITAAYNGVGGSAITCRELPGGNVKWTVPWKMAAQPTFMEMHADAAGQPILVAAGAGCVGVVDAETGKFRWSAAHNNMNAQVLGAGVEAGQRVAVVTRSYMVVDPKNPQDEMSLKVYGLADGKLQTEVTLAKSARMTNLMLPQPLGELGKWLPAARMEVKQPNPKTPAVYTNHWSLVAYGLETKGEMQKLPLPGNKETIEMIRAPIQVVAGQLLVVYKDGIVAYATDTAGKKQ